jgi:osmoprotectant transport system ATP-binding protein
VARFVGADRGLKRLSLSRVRDLELRQTVTARSGEPASEARRKAQGDPFGYLLLVDGDNRPIGWIDERRLSGDGVISEAMAAPTSPFLEPETTLKDALSMLLDAEVQTGVVVDSRGRLLGLVTVDAIAARLRNGASGSVSPEPEPIL